MIFLFMFELMDKSITLVKQITRYEKDESGKFDDVIWFQT